MATIKSYTDIEQSRKLVEILPIESADMYWSRCTITDFGDNTLKISYAVEPCNISQFRNTKDDVPAWSLAALINVASTYCNRLEITLRTNKKYNVFAVKGDFVFRSFDEFPDGIDNLIDCCYEMILMLRKFNLL